ncbi:MAG: hypothetical protein KDJ19_11040 [Hyphomicrobiaceae bacterium]|nr:hypothetical protein [Hyphomicrobiaceae bacterium]MCC0024224.1 hypothetical protein [Hyphomicrobiaceae bacterium]
MLRLTGMIYLLAAPVLMGIAITAILTMDLHSYDGNAMMWAGIGGAIAGIPVAILIAMRLDRVLKKN